MNKRILVVDDDADIRTMLEAYFEGVGFDVSTAEDGYDAVEKALADRPDVILMDMAMPLVDGVNSIRAMREIDELRSTPIIGLTGFGAFYRPLALDAGCDSVLTKPIDLGKLRPLILDHIGH